MRKYTIKEKDVLVGKEVGSFFCSNDYEIERKIFMKEAKTKVVDYYIKGTRKNKILLTLVNYKRED